MFAFFLLSIPVLLCLLWWLNYLLLNCELKVGWCPLIAFCYFLVEKQRNGKLLLWLQPSQRTWNNRTQSYTIPLSWHGTESGNVLFSFHPKGRFFFVSLWFHCLSYFNPVECRNKCWISHTIPSPASESAVQVQRLLRAKWRRKVVCTHKLVQRGGLEWSRQLFGYQQTKWEKRKREGLCWSKAAAVVGIWSSEKRLSCACIG